MTDLIERLRALLAKATRGPWHAMYAHWNQSDIVTFDLSFRKSTGEIAGRGKYYEVCPYIRPEDASLITESINALPTLLDALEAKERKLTRIANIAARLAEIARSVHIGDLERAEISALELELVKETL